MSAITLRKMARHTIGETDTILSLWQEAFGRGDIDPKEATAVVDALLDLRTACSGAVEAARAERMAKA